MSKLVKAFAALVLALLTAVALPTASTAADPAPSPSPTLYGCLGDTPGEYNPPLPCLLRLSVLEPICDNEVPKLRYVSEAVGTPNTTVTITWVNPTGPDFVQADLPLSGTVNWPGAVEKDGRGVDWPGWTQLPDGTWVEGDEWDWVRPSVEVRFEVNPTATVTVAYPPSSPVCLTNPPPEPPIGPTPTPEPTPDTTEPVVSPPEPSPSSAVPGVTPPELSATGSNAVPLALVGGGLLVAGGIALVVAMRHRRPQE